MDYQTTVQNEGALRGGSLLLEIGNSLNTLINAGALRDLSFENTGEATEISFDNAQGIKVFRNGKRFAFNATLMEINWDVIKLFNGGQVEVVNVAGTPITGDQLVAQLNWKIGQAIEIAKTNADGTTPIINSVNGSYDGVITDGQLVKLANGNWAIYFPAGGDVTTENQDITINYTVTPSASKKITFKNSGVTEDKFMRLTNTRADGKKVQYICSGVANITPINIDFASDEETDFATLPISLQGQLIEIIDEQATT